MSIRSRGLTMTLIKGESVTALMAGCLARDRGNTDPNALDRIIAVVCQGLRTEPS